MTVTAEVEAAQLADLIKQVQAGHEVLLIQGHELIAKLVPAIERAVNPSSTFRVRSFKGHRVRTPTNSQGDLAEEMFRHP
jgi:antitoxin (DNA-binding transcriptional repressor) of toxin-antitoxin stability system